MIASRLGRYRLRLPAYQKVLTGIAGVVLVVIASVSFLYLRVAGYELKGKGKNYPLWIVLEAPPNCCTNETQPKS